MCSFLTGILLAPANHNYKIEEGMCNTNTQSSIPRADVAHFMLAALQTDKYDWKAMAVANLWANLLGKIIWADAEEGHEE